MAANKDTIQGWFERGVQNGSTHMIVVCDTYDWEDYPVFVSQSEDVRKVEEKYRGNMQRVMEVYNLQQDMNSQLNEHRAFNY